MILDHLSASGVHLYNQCPLAFFTKYRDKTFTDETNDTYAKYGTLVHGVLENIANGEYMFLEEAIREYVKGFPDCGLTDDMKLNYYKQGRQLIEERWEELNELDIVGAEVNFKVQPFEEVPNLVGFIDLVYRDEKGRLIVRDYKTSKKYTKTQMGKQWQPYFYSVACKEIFGEYPYKFEFDFVRFNEKNSILITENFIKMGNIVLSGIVKKIEQDLMEANYSPFYCTNFCSCRSICPLYNAKKG